MPNVTANFKNGKIISYKIKVYLGRDENGKQVFRCKTWTPGKQMSETRARQMAEKEAILWEQQLRDEKENEKSQIKQITFSDFVNNEWFPNQMNEKERRMSTIAFHTYNAFIIFSAK